MDDDAWDDYCKSKVRDGISFMNLQSRLDKINKNQKSWIIISDVIIYKNTKKCQEI
jgi:hypothetical protein